MIEIDQIKTNLDTEDYTPWLDATILGLLLLNLPLIIFKMHKYFDLMD